MINIVSVLLYLSMIMVIFSAFIKKSKVCYDLVDLVGDYKPSKLDNGASSSLLLSANSTSGKNETVSLANNSFQADDISPAELPDYNLESDNLKKFQEEDRYIKVLTNADIRDFNSYANKLLSNGFAKYDENEINNCRFMTLINKCTFVSMSYMAIDKKILVVSEPLGALYPRAVDNKYTSKGMQSLFTGIKNQNNPIYSGMGFIIRLDDGSFIIIDGGGGDRNHIDSNNLLNILKEQSPEGTTKPVITAWILTHCHDDHLGVFNAFSNDFHDKVELKQIYYNFPLEKDIRDHAPFMFRDDYYSYPEFNRIIKDYYSDADIIRPHSGEKYYIKNAIIEMLFTYDDHFPKCYENGDLGNPNATSLIFTIEIGNQKMMIPGDAESPGMNKVSSNFGNHIQCDILQLAHHGQNGTVNFYFTVNPKYVFIPISHVDENRLSKIEANKWLVKNGNVKQFISFWSQNVTIPLPYNPTDDQIYDRIPTAKTEYYQYPLH